MTELRRLYIFLSVVAVILMVLTTATSFILKEEAAWGDLLLNLSAEVFGVLVTVFVIERIIRWREEQTWRSVKLLVYEKLQTVHYQFEQDLTATLPQPAAALLSEVLDSHTLHMRLREILVDDVLNRTSESEYRLKRVEELVKHYFFETHGVLFKYRTVLGEVFNSSGPMLDQALLESLHLLDRRIAEALNTVNQAFLEHERLIWERTRLIENKNYLREELDTIFEPLATSLASVIQTSTILNGLVERKHSRNL